MALRTNRISLRGEWYTVKEPSGADQIAIRKLMANDNLRHGMEAFVTHLCCVDPKFTEVEAKEQPQGVLNGITAEAMRLRDEGDVDPKVPTTA
jgi:hypothetical protein